MSLYQDRTGIAPAFSSGRHHRWPPSPRPSDSFPGHGDAAAPAATGAAKRHWNATDDGDPHFHAAATEKVTLGVERPTDPCLVRWQPLASCDSRLDCNHPLLRLPRSSFPRAVLHPCSATGVRDSFHRGEDWFVVHRLSYPYQTDSITPCASNGPANGNSPIDEDGLHKLAGNVGSGDQST